MNDATSKELYKQRQDFGETPCAVIKACFGLRRFLLRGLPGVQAEFQWVCSGFNLDAESNRLQFEFRTRPPTKNGHLNPIRFGLRADLNSPLASQRTVMKTVRALKRSDMYSSLCTRTSLRQLQLLFALWLRLLWLMPQANPLKAIRNPDGR